MRTIFRPSLVLTLCWLVALVILLTLGTWQMRRLEWKTGLIAELEAGLAAEPTALPAQVATPETWRFRRVTVSGRFDLETAFHLVRARDGRNGFQVLVPLVRRDAPAVLVDRGWIPREVKQGDGVISLPAGNVTVTGMVRPGSEPGIFTPDNDAAGNLWFWLDYAAFEDLSGRPLLSLTVVAEPGGNGDPDTAAEWPRAYPPAFNMRNNHLGYAVTWYSFALIMTVIFILMGRGRARALREQERKL